MQAYTKGSPLSFPNSVLWCSCTWSSIHVLGADCERYACHLLTRVNERILTFFLWFRHAVLNFLLGGRRGGQERRTPSFNKLKSLDSRSITLCHIWITLSKFFHLKLAFPHSTQNKLHCVGLFGLVFSTPSSITPLSLKLDYSNFIQNYFGIR